MTEIILVEVDSQPIELCKLLKIANLVGGGGEAKMVISEGYVAVNNEVEFQKRKKIYHNDFVEFNGEVIQLHVDESLIEEVQTPTKVQKDKKIKPNKPKSTPKQRPNNELNVTKRKPINF